MIRLRLWAFATLLVFVAAWRVVSVEAPHAEGAANSGVTLPTFKVRPDD